MGVDCCAASRGDSIEESSFVGLWGLATSSTSRATFRDCTAVEQCGGGNFDFTAVFETAVLLPFWCL